MIPSPAAQDLNVLNLGSTTLSVFWELKANKFKLQLTTLNRYYQNKEKVVTWENWRTYIYPLKYIGIEKAAGWIKQEKK